MAERVLATKVPEAKRDNKTSQKRKTEHSQSLNSSTDRILFLQRTIGNQAVQKLIKPAALQTRPGNYAKKISTVSTHSIIHRQQGTEEPVLRTRRMAVISAARNAILRLTGALSGGYLWPFETVNADRINIAHPLEAPFQETTAQRGSRLRQMTGDLIRMVSRLESAPIPASWLGETATFPGGTLHIGNFPQPWQDTAMFYAHFTGAMRRNMDDITHNLLYLNTNPLPTRRVTPERIRSGIGLGIYIVVPDPENAPLVYHHLTPYEGWQTRGVIMEVWHDDFGYYYPYSGQKHYLPGRP